MPESKYNNSGIFSELFGKIPSWIWNLSFFSYLIITSLFIYGLFYFKASLKFNGKVNWNLTSYQPEITFESEVYLKFPMKKGQLIKVLNNGTGRNVIFEAEIDSIIYSSESKYSTAILKNTYTHNNSIGEIIKKKNHIYVIKVSTYTLFYSIFN